jgi:hypothetical protein
MDQRPRNWRDIWERLISPPSSGLGQMLALLAVIAAAFFPRMQVWAPLGAFILLLFFAIFDSRNRTWFHRRAIGAGPYVTFLAVAGCLLFAQRYTTDYRAVASKVEAVARRLDGFVEVPLSDDPRKGGLYVTRMGDVTVGSTHCYQSGQHEGLNWTIDPLDQSARLSFDRHARKGPPEASSGSLSTNGRLVGAPTGTSVLPCDLLSRLNLPTWEFGWPLMMSLHAGR